MSKKTLKLETLAVAHDSYELIVKIKLKCTLINHDTHTVLVNYSPITIAVLKHGTTSKTSYVKTTYNMSLGQ